jgi:hypothetical protein
MWYDAPRLCFFKLGCKYVSDNARNGPMNEPNQKTSKDPRVSRPRRYQHEWRDFFGSKLRWEGTEARIKSRSIRVVFSNLNHWPRVSYPVIRQNPAPRLAQAVHDVNRYSFEKRFSIWKPRRRSVVPRLSSHRIQDSHGEALRSFSFIDTNNVARAAKSNENPPNTTTCKRVTVG